MSLRTFAKSRLNPGAYQVLGSAAREAQLALTHWRSVRRMRALPATELRLNCGCGGDRKPGWINIDAESKVADLRLDLRRRMPFADNSVSMIYSEHFFEHLEYPDEAMLFLGESLRVLKPGGRFRVGVPDTEWPLRDYAAGEDSYFKLAREMWHPQWCDTRMHHINYHFRQGKHHKYAYDEETLAKVLTDAGFVSAARSDFDPEFDTEHRRIGTLYLDAFKPG